MKKKFLIFLSFALLFNTFIFAQGEEASKKRKLFLVGYSTPGEAIEKEIGPAFFKKWAAEHSGEEIEFQFSWGGSSTQARNVISGLDADVVYLSLWSDVNSIEKSGLITHDWNASGHGIVSKSVVVFRVEPGNPLNLKDWPDLLKRGVKVLTPNPQTSGGARWNVLALYGAILKNGGSPEDAEKALRALYRNVVTFAENARASIQDFERGVGNVAITYENEALLLRKYGKSIEFVTPSSTIYVENPAAVVDAYADKHGMKDVAQAFVEFLRLAQAQRILSEWGFRSIDKNIEKEYASRYPEVSSAFDIEFLGGWPKVDKEFFGPGSLWEKIVRTERKE
ncbi:MAG: sulfate ABC transporter substrate-binding protein [Chlamydiae bacterium]|nr:sulfate ABC transporter substrate-binding protein [Chlamydiota bacterium]MBI3266979.1 sulfate ABC transporter substrate-binding protein [Chlamydiota bacterium]